MSDLILIGEKINYSVPRIGKMLAAGDLGAIRRIARVQVERGADYIDVNVGPMPPEVMAEVVGAVHDEVSVPLCIDSTDPALLEAGLVRYDAGSKPGDRGPILNSAIESNAGRVLSLRSRFGCQVVLLVSERLEGGLLERNALAGQAVDTASRLFDQARGEGFEPGEIFIDPGMPPIASDIDGLVNTALETIAGVRSHAALGESHIVVGLSNFTAGLPRHVRLPLQNAFLTLAVRNGLDTLIGDPARKYRLLESRDAHLAWLERILESSGTRRLEELTSSPLYRTASSADNGDKPSGGRSGGDQD